MVLHTRVGQVAHFRFFRNFSTASDPQLSVMSSLACITVSDVFLGSVFYNFCFNLSNIFILKVLCVCLKFFHLLSMKEMGV